VYAQQEVLQQWKRQRGANNNINDNSSGNGRGNMNEQWQQQQQLLQLQPQLQCQQWRLNKGASEQGQMAARVTQMSCCCCNHNCSTSNSVIPQI
jgi:hypothetical protein